jgi:hypothetical protein
VVLDEDGEDIAEAALDGGEQPDSLNVTYVIGAIGVFVAGIGGWYSTLERKRREKNLSTDQLIEDQAEPEDD